MKLPRSLTDEQDERVLARLPRRVPDSREKRALRDRLTVAAANHVGDVAKMVADGKVGDARARWLSRFTRACGAGHVVAGIPETHFTDRELLVLDRLTVAELGYAGRFVSREMSDDARSALYGGAIYAAFYFGWLAALPPSARIAWNLSVAENCRDCLALGADNPYSKPGFGSHPLPTVPRAGETQCLANCRCWLTASGSTYFSQLPADLKIEIDKIGGQDVPTDSVEAVAAASMYLLLVQAHIYRLRRAEAQPEEAVAWNRMARAAADEIDAQATALHHGYRLAYLPEEAIADVEIAKLIGMRHVPPGEIDDWLVGAVAGVLTMRGAKQGLIRSVTRNPPAVVFDDGVTMQIGPESGTLLFVREGS